MQVRFTFVLEDLDYMKDLYTGKDLTSIPETQSHADWAYEWMKKYDEINKDNIDGIVRDEIALVFSHVLENAGVYKRTDEGFAAFDRFIDTL